jgi:MFS transporter, PAT family, beta-lactamase induction signal transducer AmpG
MPHAVSRPSPAKGTHPVWFLILFAPMGITNGYVVVTLAYLLVQAGIGVQEVSYLVGVSLFPHMIKFLWAPLVDTTLTNKKWFLYSNIVSGILMICTSVIRDPATHMSWVYVMVFGFCLANTFNTMSADGLMAHAATPEEKGRAGGWSQAGNLGGSGLGGGAGLWLAQHIAGGWVVGTVLGLMCLATSLALLAVKEPGTGHRAAHYLKSLVNVGKDVWGIVCKRMGFLALVLMLLPIGVGAAQNLWAAVAGDWHASADTVALVTGALSGVISMAGCIVAGFICDKMDRKTAYNIFGILSAGLVIGMALAPRSEAMFVVFTCTYAFLLGMSYAAFGAVVLEAIGAGAAATKYNIFAGLANIPIFYQGVIDGWAHDKWNAGGMLCAEALATFAGLAFFYLVMLAARQAFGKAQPSS